MHFSSNTENKVYNFIKKNNLISPGDSILIALSGGPDSVALFVILFELKRLLQVNLLAAHLNHSLRSRDSEEDQIFVENLCKKFSIPFYYKKVDVKKYAQEKKIGIEEAGRTLRYQFFEELMDKLNFQKIATGHTLDDAVETFFFNLVRGAGISGLTSIPIKRDKIIRPILCLSKKEILEYLKLKKIKFRIDKTNLQDGYSRNYIRNKIIPKLRKINPNLLETIGRTIEQLTQIENLILSNFEKYKNVIELQHNCIIVRTEHNYLLSDFIFIELLKRKIIDVFGISLSYENIQQILNLIKLEKGKLTKLPQKLIAIKESNSIYIVKKDDVKNVYQKVIIGEEVNINGLNFLAEEVKLNEVEFSRDKTIEYIDAEKISGELILRNWKEGDKLLPIGFHAYKKVSDILTDEKIPAYIKKKILVLCDEREIIWILGVRSSEKYKINENTKKVIKLRVRYESEF